VTEVAAPVWSRHRARLRATGPTLAVVALGGGLGALARYGMSGLLPVPWATFLINLIGCFLIGVLMVLVTEVYAAHRLVRPFLGVGVLGGFTTFSTYAVEFRALLVPGRVGLAFGYLFGTLLGAMLAVVLGVWLTRALAPRRA
jgi:CrcB protein